MPRKLEFERSLRTCQISDEALKYFHNRKAQHNEPMYRVVDRIIGQMRSGNNAELIHAYNEQLKIINDQREVIKTYFERIKTLEADQQMRFVLQNES